jgi:hypothetical protein
MIEVGPERFNSICSDDTGNTHNARGLTQKKYELDTQYARPMPLLEQSGQRLFDNGDVGHQLFLIPNQ